MFLYHLFLISPPGINMFLRSFSSPPTEKEIQVPCGYNDRIAIFRFLKIESDMERGNCCYYAFVKFLDEGDNYG